MPKITRPKEAPKAAVVRNLEREMIEVQGTGTFEEALHLLALQARLIVGAHQSALSYIPDGNFKAATHTHSFSDKYRKYDTYDVMPTGGGIWGLIVENRIPVRMTQEELISHPSWKEFSGLKDERGLEHPAMRGWLAVPILRQDGGFIGVLQLSDKLEGDFTEDDQEELRRLGDLVRPTFELRYLNEELQKHAAELEFSNKELEAFTYSVSHDLRAPLRHIHGYTKILVDEYGANLPDEGLQFLEQIRNSALRMDGLIGDLLDLSRIGREKPSLQATGLNTLVEEALSELRDATEGRRIEWKVASLPFLVCDPGLMRQVFRNLLSNAVKFTRPHETATIQVGMEILNEEQVFFVRDDGVGFDMRFADKLFGVFQRLHRQEDFEGTGIGLAIVGRIIHNHGGRVWAEAELNRGATVYFTCGPPGNQQTSRGEGL